jgi:hypothetical protein
MQILYERFDPRPVALDETRLRGAIRLFTWYYGGDCTSDRFMREERDYKMEIAERWQQAADVDDLAAALEDGTGDLLSSGVVCQGVVEHRRGAGFCP